MIVKQFQTFPQGIATRAWRIAKTILLFKQSQLSKPHIAPGSPRSVYFYTLHKCASSLFSSYVLANADGLVQADYSQDIVDGKIKPGAVLTFQDRGFVYGPIRVSTDNEAIDSQMFVKPTTEHDFIRDKIAIFLIRDPRDILVSCFYSFGFSHALSPVEEIRCSQERQREHTRQFTLEEYVSKYAFTQNVYFNKICDLANVCEQSVILKYEDMVDDFEKFVAQLCKYIPLRNSVVQELYKRSRPRAEEDIYAHQRSGRVGGFRDKLSPATVEALNQELQGILTRFNYKP